MKKKLNESPQPVNQSLYTSVNFRDGVVGSSYPSRDKINPSLLLDIETAAKRAGVTASVTTAVSGHKYGTRHETGNEVDIAMFNGQGYASKDDAVKRGIYKGIYDFIQQLISMGYVYNVESGNDKAILSFGFEGHENHVHVSRNSDGTDNSVVNKTPDNKDKTKDTKSPVTTTTTTSGPNFDIYGGLLNNLDGNGALKKVGNKIWDETMGKVQKALGESTNNNSNKLNEEVKRIKKMMDL